MPSALRLTRRAAFAQIQGDNGVQNQFLDQLRIVGVKTEGLQLRNGQYFAADDQVLEDNESTRVLQGRLENANVDPVTELVKMITLQRH